MKIRSCSFGCRVDRGRNARFPPDLHCCWSQVVVLYCGALLGGSLIKFRKQSQSVMSNTLSGYYISTNVSHNDSSASYHIMYTI